MRLGSSWLSSQAPQPMHSGTCARVAGPRHQIMRFCAFMFACSPFEGVKQTLIDPIQLMSSMPGLPSLATVHGCHFTCTGKKSGRAESTCIPARVFVRAQHHRHTLQHTWHKHCTCTTMCSSSHTCAAAAVPLESLSCKLKCHDLAICIQNCGIIAEQWPVSLRGQDDHNLGTGFVAHPSCTPVDSRHRPQHAGAPHLQTLEAGPKPG